jgi:hypothetical protein
MTYPKEYFQSHREGEQEGFCFVLMPFEREFDPVYETISDALKSVGTRCRRADKLSGGKLVMEDVLREIARATLIAADLTSGNPNVCYELGIVHMVKDPERVLLLTQSSEEGVPFDVRAYRRIRYSTDCRGLEDLRLQLSAAAREIAGLLYRFTITREDSHLTNPRFGAPDRCLYSFEISDAMIGDKFVKCRVRTKRHAIGQPVEIVEDENYGFGEGDASELAFLPWLLKLDMTTESEAMFSVVPASEERRG